MIDIHCHILPDIDDGPACRDDAVEMARYALKTGTETIFATPHFMNGVYSTTMRNIWIKAKSFSNTLRRYNIPLTILDGAEIRIAHDTAQMIEKGDVPSLGGSNYYLIELPSTFIRDGILKVFGQMVDIGAVPIIAHPERNHMIMKHPKLVSDFIHAGVLCQLTAQSVLGKNDRLSFNLCRQMIQDDLAHFIASDGHDLDFRKPTLEHAFKAVKTIAGEQTAQQILIENPKVILDKALEGNRKGKKAG